MLDTKALSLALAAIRSRLAEIEEQIATLEVEREWLRKGEEDLSALLGESKTPPEAMVFKRGPGRPRKPREAGGTSEPRANTFRSRLLTAIQKAPEGLSTPRIRDMFPDQKQSTLVGTLSNLRRDGLLRSEFGVWLPVEPGKPDETESEEEKNTAGTEMLVSNETGQALPNTAS